MPPKQNFNDIVSNMRSSVEAIAKLTVRQYRRQAVRDGRKMITSMKKDLRRWTDLLDQGMLTTEDFEWLVHAQASTIKMASLEKAGLASLRVDHFRKTMFNLVVDSVFEAVLPSDGPTPTPS